MKTTASITQSAASITQSATRKKDNFFDRWFPKLFIGMFILAGLSILVTIGVVIWAVFQAPEFFNETLPRIIESFN